MVRARKHVVSVQTFLAEKTAGSSLATFCPMTFVTIVVVSPFAHFCHCHSLFWVKSLQDFVLTHTSEHYFANQRK